MRKVNKALLDSFLIDTKRFWNYGGSYETTAEIAKLLERFTGVDWVSWKDLVDSIYHPNGFNKDLEVAKFYEILKILGWEVSND